MRRLTLDELFGIPRSNGDGESTMDGKVALEEHVSTELNNRTWNAKREQDHTEKPCAQDDERRLPEPHQPASDPNHQGAL